MPSNVASTRGIAESRVGGNSHQNPVGVLVTPPDALELGHGGTQGNINLFKAYRYGRLIKLLSLIDMFFLIFWVNDYTWMIGVGVLCLCGYFGARDYRPGLTSLYAIYGMLQMSLRVYLLFDQAKMFFLFVSVLSIGIELWCLSIVYRFVSIVSRLSTQDINHLKSGTAFPQVMHQGRFF